MASIRSFKNGAGGAAGADLAVLPSILTSGVYWYVGNAVPGASDSNAGTERGKPLSTLGQGFTNAAAGDTVVLLQHHAETLGSSIVVSKAGLNIVGEGTGLAVPRLSVNAAIGLEVTANYVTLDNIYFPATVAINQTVVQSEAIGLSMNALQFDCGATNTTQALALAGSGSAAATRLTNSRFTSVAATPTVAIECASNLAGLTVDNLTLDGGSFGWVTYAWRMDATITRIRATRVYLLNGSNIIIGTGCTGTIQVAGATGDSAVNWTP